MVSGTCANKANWSLAEPKTLVLFARAERDLLCSGGVFEERDVSDDASAPLRTQDNNRIPFRNQVKCLWLRNQPTGLTKDTEVL